MLAPRSKPTPTAAARFALLSGLILLIASGCQTGTYRAAKLPPDLCCTPSANTEEITLSGVSGSGYNSALIAPGDLLEVTIATGREDEKLVPLKTRVADSGSITLPMIGPVPVAGLEAFEAGENIRALAVNRGIYRQPQVTVDVAKKAVNRITVLGKVNEPGVHELPRGATDVLTALAAAGGLAEDAGTIVEVQRQSSASIAQASIDSGGDSTSEPPEGVQLAAFERDAPFGPPPTLAETSPAAGQTVSSGSPPRTVQIDLADPGASREHDFRLRDGDLVQVFPRPERMVYVGGLVRQPGQFEIPRNQDMTLLQAIQSAGDKSSPVADKVVVIRRVPGRAEPVVIEARISAAKKNGRENILLAAGDVVSVEQTASTMVVDTMMNFVRVSVGLAGRTVAF